MRIIQDENRAWDEIIGNNRAKQTLRNAARMKRGMLVGVFGPSGTAKTTLCRLTARAALCDAQNGDPCWKCEWCGKGSMNESEYAMYAILRSTKNQASEKGYYFFNARDKSTDEIRGHFTEILDERWCNVVHIDEICDLARKGRGEQWTAYLDLIAERNILLLGSGLSGTSLDCQFLRRFISVNTSKPTQEELQPWLKSQLDLYGLTLDHPGLLTQLVCRAYSVVGFLINALEFFHLSGESRISARSIADWQSPCDSDPWQY